MIQDVLKEIPYNEYLNGVKDLNELQYAFCNYSKKLIIPSGLGLLGSCKYFEENCNSDNPKDFKYYKKIGAENVMMLGSEAYKAFQKAFNYYKENHRWE